MSYTLHFNIYFKFTFKYLADIFIQQDKCDNRFIFISNNHNTHNVASRFYFQVFKNITLQLPLNSAMLNS